MSLNLSDIFGLTGTNPVYLFLGTDKVGNSELPDSNDPNAFMKEIMERMAPNPAIEAERLEREKKLTEMLVNSTNRNNEISDPETAEKA